MQMTVVDKANASSLAMSAASSVFITLMPIMGVVFVAFLVIGSALPVLPLHVHQGLGFGTFTVGLVTGSQFAASLFSRVWSGRTCDNQGAKYAVLLGLAAASAAGLLYLLSLRLATQPSAYRYCTSRSPCRYRHRWRQRGRTAADPARQIHS
jgi:MFS family permease